MTATDVSAPSSLDATLLRLAGWIMVPPLVFCVLVTGLWVSYLLIHTLGFIGAWASCAIPLAVIGPAAKSPRVSRIIAGLNFRF